jgi:hypothetical protein
MFRQLVEEADVDALAGADGHRERERDGLGERERVALAQRRRLGVRRRALEKR